MFDWHVSWNAGMGLAVALLVLGGVLMVIPGDEGGVLHTVGLGIVVLAGVVYLVARVTQFVKDRAK